MRFLRAKPGEPITAERWNQLLDALEQSRRITVTPPLTIHQDATGTAIGYGGAPRDIRAVLTAALAYGGEADATELLWDGSDWVETGSVITIVDDLLSNAALPIGAHVMARPDPANGKYMLVRFSGPAKWIKFTLATALEADDASQASCPVVDFWDGTDPGAEVTVLNELGFVGDADAAGYALRDDVTGEYKIVQLECTADASANYPLLADDGTAAEPSYSYASDPGTGWFLSAPGELTASIDETPVVTIDSTGITIFSSYFSNSFSGNRMLYSSSGKAITEAAAATNGQLLIGSTGAAPVLATLTAGANVTITPGAGSITIAAGSSYTTENAQDDIGGILVDSATIDFTYSDATPSITAIVIDGSLTNAKLADMTAATVKGRASGAGTGAPTDLTAAQLVAIINTADGAGSGLDADLLDGLSSAAFAAASHAHAAADITSGTIATARLGSGTANSTTYLRGDQTWAAPTAAAHALLSSSHSDTTPGSPFTGDVMIGNILGLWGRLTGNVASTRKYLTQTGTGSVSAEPEWNSILAADLPNDGVTNARLADMAAATVKGRAVGAGTGDPTDLTAAQLVTIINTADGAGSGLDADLLDGLSSAVFVLLAGLSGGQTIIGGTGTTDDLILRVTSGVGTTGSQFVVQVGNNGAVTACTADHLGNWGFGVAPVSTTRLGIATSADIPASTSYLALALNVTDATTASNSHQAIALNMLAISTIGSGLTNSSYLAPIVSGGYHQGDGTVNTVFLARITGGTLTPGVGTVTNLYGAYIDHNQSAGSTITAGYGIFLGTMKGTTKYSIYQFDSAAPNYFAGSVGIGSTTFPSGGGTPVLVMGQASGNPTGMPANTAGIFAKDVAGTCELFTIDEAGNVTQQTSHGFEQYSPSLADPYPFSFSADNEFLGKSLNADVSGALLAIEVILEEFPEIKQKLAERGLNTKFVHLRDLDTKQNWSEREVEKERLRQAAIAHHDRQQAEREQARVDWSKLAPEEQAKQPEPEPLAEERPAEYQPKPVPAWLAARGVKAEAEAVDRRSPSAGKKVRGKS